MNTQLINFTIPKPLLISMDKFAKKTRRSRSEFLREAVRRVLNEEQERARDFLSIKASAKKSDFSEKEAIDLVEKTRSQIAVNR